MSFGDFLSKAAKFAGKAIVAVASEVINQGPSRITETYLENASKLSLTSSQRSLVESSRSLNQRLSSQKRDLISLSNEIKINNEKSLSINHEIENKAKDIWIMISRLITVDGFSNVVNFQKVAFVVFNNEVKSKVSLLEFIDGLPNANEPISIDKFKCDFLNYFNESIPCEPISDVNNGFAESLVAALKYYSSFEMQCQNDLNTLSHELNKLESLHEDKKEKIAGIDEELKPLLAEVRGFCDPLFKERKEMAAKKR